MKKSTTPGTAAPHDTHTDEILANLEANHGSLIDKQSVRANYTADGCNIEFQAVQIMIICEINFDNDPSNWHAER